MQDNEDNKDELSDNKVISTGSPSNSKVNATDSPKENIEIQSFSLFNTVTNSFIIGILFTSVLLNLASLHEGNLANFSNPGSLVTLIFGLIIITILSLVISFWNYHIRAIYLKDGPALVPEKWGKIILDLIKNSNSMNNNNQKIFQKLKENSDIQNKKSEDLLESFLTLQETLSAREKEISRLKRGYDAKIFKKFLLRFIRIDRSLREMKKEFSGKENEKNYKYLSRIMQDALEECGVERFTPELGSDFRDAGDDVADEFTTEATNDPEMDFIMSDVISIGYKLIGEDEDEVIIPSKVKIFRKNIDQIEEI